MITIHRPFPADPFVVGATPRGESRDRPRGGGSLHVPRALAGALVLTLAACGGGGGGGGGDDAPAAGAPPVTPTVTPPAGNGLVLGGVDMGREASAVGDDDLLRNAVARSSAGIGTNLGNLRRLIADDDDGGTGPSVPGGLPSGEDEDGMDGEELLVMVDDGAEALLERTLGIDDPNARVTREGDVITVDPDDAALCSDDPSADFDDALVLDDDGTSSTCLQLVAGLTTRVEALTEESGVITYLYDGEPVIATGYSPAGVVQELRLAGVARVLRRLETIEEREPGSLVPMLFTGTLRWAAEVFDDTPGSESGAIEVSVTETLELGDSDTAAGLSLGPSRVLRIDVNEATDAVSASVGWGALRLVTESGDSDGNRSLTTLNLGGLTLDLDANAGDMASAISLRNVGIGGVPLTIQIDSNDALTLALETFGITLDGDSGELRFDTALGVDLMIDNLGGLIEDQARDYMARFTANASAGTTLVERAATDDELLEIGAGSLTVGVSASDSAGSTQSEVTANAGACLGDRDPQADGTAEVTDEAERLAADLDLVAIACP